MRLAIMQPYLFPYLGYYQLLVAADRFVVYDDVNFIKGGWINRNNLLVGGKKWLFTVPLEAPSPNRKICDIDLNPSPAWKQKLLQTIEQNYRRAPHFGAVLPVLQRILSPENSATRTIADLVRLSLRELITYLQLPVELVPDSARYHNQHLRAQERVLDICRQEQATRYVNAQGGMHLYNKAEFAAQGINLEFLIPELRPYRQSKEAFVPGLSIIDVLMHNSVAETQELLRAYTLV